MPVGPMGYEKRRVWRESGAQERARSAECRAGGEGSRGGGEEARCDGYMTESREGERGRRRGRAEEVRRI